MPEMDKETKEILEEIKEESPKEEVKEEPEIKTEVEDEPEERVEEVLPNREERTPQTVPLPKFMKLKKEREALETQIGSLQSEIEKIKSSNQTPIQKDEEISSVVSSMSEELANDLGLDKSKLETVFGKLANTIIAKTKMPDDVVNVIKSAKEKEAWEKEESLFNEELNTLKKEYPNEKIDKDALHELAFDEDYAKKSLYEIHFRYIKPTQIDSPKKKSAESAKGGVDRVNDVKDFNNLSPDEILSMSDEEFDEFSKEAEKGHKRNKLIPTVGN